MIKFTNDNKGAMVEDMQMEMETRNLVMWEIPEIRNELAEFNYEVTKAKKVIYQGEENKHDDIVTSIMLALYAIKNRSRASVD